MKISHKHIFLLLIGLFINNILFSQKSNSQLDEFKETGTAFLKAESVKAVEANLIKALGAERNSGAVTTAMKKFWESTKGLDKTKVQALAQRFSNASKSSIQHLVNMSPSQLSSYARDVTSNIKIDSKTLKNIIYGAGDKAGNATLQILAEMDNLIDETGTVSAELLKKMRSEAAGLDPKQASAFYNLLKGKLATDWKDLKNLDNTTDGLGKYVGTVVDGVFVLNDAYDIFYSDDEAELKAIKATGKIIDYGASTAAGAASTALGGGLGAGLVIAFTANRVSTLYTEIAMLQKEREAVKDALLNERINNGILVRRQLLNISNKIKSGELNNANSLLSKLEKFLITNNCENVEKLFELHSELEENSKMAERNQRINEVINEARRPYQKALNFYNKGVELNQAKIYASETLTILNNNLKTYPEIKGLTAISKTQQLINLIDQKIANATPISITGTNSPKRVYTGQSIDIKVFVNGGIPYYRATGDIYGNISDDKVVTMYWDAPTEIGKEKLTFNVIDCMGRTASFTVSIEVVEISEFEEDEEFELTGKKIERIVDIVDGPWKISSYSKEIYNFFDTSEFGDNLMEGIAEKLGGEKENTANRLERDRSLKEKKATAQKELNEEYLSTLKLGVINIPEAEYELEEDLLFLHEYNAVIKNGELYIISLTKGFDLKKGEEVKMILQEKTENYFEAKVFYKMNSQIGIDYIKGNLKK